MKLSTLLISAGLILTATSSCTLDSKSIERIVRSQAGKDDFRDSEKWGKVVTKTIDLPDFHSIVLTGNADIKFSQADEQSLSVTGNEKTIKLYSLKVKDGVLFVEDTNDSILHKPSIKLQVAAPSLLSVNMSGLGDIDIKNTAEFDHNLTISVSGMGDIDLGNISCKTLDISMSGMGDVKANKVKCQKAFVNVSGKGDINTEIKADDINVNLSGSGDADLEVKCTNLNITAIGTGDIEVEGECVNLTKEEGGLSSIDTRDLKAQSIKLK